MTERLYVPGEAVCATLTFTFRVAESIRVTWTGTMSGELNTTRGVAANPVPVIVRIRSTSPWVTVAGETPERVGALTIAGVTSNPPSRLPVPPSGLVTATSLKPSSVSRLESTEQASWDVPLMTQVPIEISVALKRKRNSVTCRLRLSPPSDPFSSTRTAKRLLGGLARSVAASSGMTAVPGALMAVHRVVQLEGASEITGSVPSVRDAYLT